MNAHKELALRALLMYKGDDLARAKHAFRNKDATQMQEEYGLSGRTCAEILAEYEKQEELINKAIAWVEAQS